MSYGIPKPARPQRRSAADNARLAIPKPGVRVRDPAALATARRDRCELCGTRDGPFEVHHVRTRGAGGDDAAANLANLCAGPRPSCHDAVHRDPDAKRRLAAVVASRDATEPGR